MKTKVWKDKDVNKYGEHDNSELRIIYPEILKMLGNIRGKQIADYGCGEGMLLQRLIYNGAIVKGYDISEAMIKKSRERIGDNGELGIIKNGEIPLPDNTLDGVVSNLTLMMCPKHEKIKKIFKEIHRTLKHQGKWIYCITHPAFIDKEFTTYRNIFNGERNYFSEEKSYQFVLKKENGEEITSSSFIDYNYTLSSHLNLFPETGFIYEKMKEVKIPKNNYPPYLILKGSKK